jgi:hypothetical protein
MTNPIARYFKARLDEENSVRAEDSKKEETSELLRYYNRVTVLCGLTLALLLCAIITLIVLWHS